MTIVSVDPRTDSIWQRLVEQERSDVFHSPAWMRVLSDTYGWAPCADVLVNEEGQPVAGLPYCRIDDMMGDRIVALPFSDYCDPLVSDVHQWKHLIDGLLAQGSPVVIRPLHNVVPNSDDRFTLSKQAKWHGLDLRPGLDTLWGNMHESTRRAIRKAERQGVELSVESSEEGLRRFFGMHLGIRKRKYGLLAQPYSFFRNIWREFIRPGHGCVMLARYQGEFIGGVIFLEWKDKLYYKFNASLPEHLSHRPNDLVIWKGIQYAAQRGLVGLDFGLSDWDQEGLVRYKRKFGGEEKTISFLRYAAGRTATAQEAQLRSVLGQLTSLLTHDSTPDSVTEKAGDTLYRFFA